MAHIETIQRQARRAALMERERKRCFYCNRVVRVWNKKTGRVPKDAATEDHITAKFHGGNNALENLVLACFACNNERGTIPADVFLKRKRGIRE